MGSKGYLVIAPPWQNRVQAGQAGQAWQDDDGLRDEFDRTYA